MILGVALEVGSLAGGVLLDILARTIGFRRTYAVGLAAVMLSLLLSTVATPNVVLLVGLNLSWGIGDAIMASSLDAWGMGVSQHSSATLMRGHSIGFLSGLLALGPMFFLTTESSRLILGAVSACGCLLALAVSVGRNQNSLYNSVGGEVSHSRSPLSQVFSAAPLLFCMVALAGIGSTVASKLWFLSASKIQSGWSGGTIQALTSAFSLMIGWGVSYAWRRRDAVVPSRRLTVLMTLACGGAVMILFSSSIILVVLGAGTMLGVYPALQGEFALLLQWFVSSQLPEAMSLKAVTDSASQCATGVALGLTRLEVRLLFLVAAVSFFICSVLSLANQGTKDSEGRA